MPYRVEQIEPSKTALIVVDMQNDFLEFPSLAARAVQVTLPNLRRAITFCRQNEIRIVYTTHVHRHGGTDLGLFAISSPKIASGAILADGSPGAEIHPAIAPLPGEIVIKKHRYSAFYGTDLEIVLRGLGVDTVVIAGVTTENCCHATARDAFFRDYKVVFLSDATGAPDYLDVGQGGMSGAEVHQAALVVVVVLSNSTADILSTGDFLARTAVPQLTPTARCHTWRVACA
jgi:ureidoacrylate peracid hydrolase